MSRNIWVMNKSRVFITTEPEIMLWCERHSCRSKTSQGTLQECKIVHFWRRYLRFQWYSNPKETRNLKETCTRVGLLWSRTLLLSKHQIKRPYLSHAIVLIKIADTNSLSWKLRLTLPPSAHASSALLSVRTQKQKYLQNRGEKRNTIVDPWRSD